jgi:uncharacterized protein
MDELHQKLEKLKEILYGCGRLAVAFSGGVDSAFLLKTAYDTLGSQCLAFTAESCIFPRRERGEAVDFCARFGIRQKIVPFRALEVEGFRQNPPDRCYLCKRRLFSILAESARNLGFSCIAEGSNMDDLGDYRPGLKAIAELGIRSPLREAGLYKSEIRALSREMGLPTWDKPSCACLASRFAYGDTITEEKLDMADRAEMFLISLGFRQQRVRIHGDTARIEVLPEQFGLVIDNRERIAAEFKKIGFAYTALDLLGYRTGSMNETLEKKQQN